MLQWFWKSNKLIGYHGFKWHLFELRVLYEAEWTPVNWITCYSVIGNQGNALSLFYKHHLLSEWNHVSFSSSAVSGSSTEHNFTKLNSHQSVFTSDFEIVQSNVNQTLHFFLDWFMIKCIGCLATNFKWQWKIKVQHRVKNMQILFYK